jgi:AbrB family looped-hinge helix DNA binding protein
MTTAKELVMHIEHAKLGEDGRLDIPAALRKDLGLHPGDTVVLESDGYRLLLRGYLATPHAIRSIVDLVKHVMTSEMASQGSD